MRLPPARPAWHLSMPQRTVSRATPHLLPPPTSYPLTPAHASRNAVSSPARFWRTCGGPSRRSAFTGFPACSAPPHCGRARSPRTSGSSRDRTSQPGSKSPKPRIASSSDAAVIPGHSGNRPETLLHPCQAAYRQRQSRPCQASGPTSTGWSMSPSGRKSEGLRPMIPSSNAHKPSAPMGHLPDVLVRAKHHSAGKRSISDPPGTWSSNSAIRAISGRCSSAKTRRNAAHATRPAQAARFVPVSRESEA